MSREKGIMCLGETMSREKGSRCVGRGTIEGSVESIQELNGRKSNLRKDILLF